MNIINNRINQLIMNLCAPEDPAEIDHNAQVLRNFIRAYGTAQRVLAVKEQHSIAQSLGLVFVDKAKLTKLNESLVEIADSYSMLEWEKNILREGLEVSMAMEPRDIDKELEGQEFEINDPDLAALMNDTMALLRGDADTETGIAWAQSLEKVTQRLKATEPVHEKDVISLYQTRYRIHMVIANVLGRARLSIFKDDCTLLKHIQVPEDELGITILFRELGEEFGYAFSGEQIQGMLNMTSDTLTAYIDALPNKKGLGQ